MSKRKVPMRKCIVSGEMFPKKDLVRIVKNKEEGILLDPTGRKNGRGAYVALDLDIAKTAKDKKSFDQAFGEKISDEFYDEVIEYVDYQLARRELKANEQ